MRIGILSTPHFRCPPKTYGGLEAVVWNLACGLSEGGHKVILYAPDESQIPPNGFLFKTGKETNTVNCDWLQVERQVWEKCNHTFQDLDILHGHNWFGFEYASKVKNPSLKVCHTHHGHVAYPWWGKPTPFKLNFIGISRFMKQQYETGYGGQAPIKIPSEYVYNGIALTQYPFQKDKSDRLLFLGRISKLKAPHLTIEIAKRMNTPLDIVGGTSFVDNPNYVNEVRSNCINTTNFVGEVDHPTKVKYLQDAKALLIPSSFKEPFGLIAVEAMACGTVPIALRDGALEEIIEDGKSGFLCNSLDEMVSAVSKISTIQKEDLRKRAEFFSMENMAKGYEELYSRILVGDEW